MMHKPCDHNEWAKNKKERRQKAKQKKKGLGGGLNSKMELELTESIKQALMSHGNMTEEQAKACWDQCLSEN